MHDLGAINSLGRVAGVDHQLGFGNDLAIVVVGVVGNDHDAVVLSQLFDLRTLHLQVVLASFADEREIGVVVADLGSFFLQQFDDGKGGRLAQIIDILLISDAQD